MSFVFLLSCNKNDDDMVNPIVGSWNVVSVNGTTVSACYQKTEISFEDNGSYTLKSYNEGSNNVCVQEDLVVGNWENTRKRIYSLQAKGSSTVREINIKFSNNNNTISTTDLLETDATLQETIVLKRK